MKRILFLFTLSLISSLSPLCAQNGTENGHRYVDLGLPSGTKWAECNIGASSKTDYGDYYAWDETSTKSSYDENNHTTYMGDVAEVKWGGSWRMPSKEQCDELFKNTTNEWTTINGVNGRLFKGKNGNSIFLPAAGLRDGTLLQLAGSDGYYWSRTLLSGGSGEPYGLYFGSSYVSINDYSSSYYGQSVRPVCLSKQKETPPQDTPDVPSKKGTDNGHTYVDLGLPSGTKWAECNVGASSSTDNGYHFAWGETSTKSNYDWSTYKYGTSYNNLTKYCTRSRFGKNSFTDNKTELDLSDDVARQQWGGSWRMPSKEQFDELLKYTTNQWTTINGVNGRLFTAKNGNTIFLPAAGYRGEASLYDAGSGGYYGSRTLYADYPGGAYRLGFDSSGVYVGYGYGGRCCGHTVRPVRP